MLTEWDHLSSGDIVGVANVIHDNRSKSHITAENLARQVIAPVIDLLNGLGWTVIEPNAIDWNALRKEIEETAISSTEATNKCLATLKRFKAYLYQDQGIK